MSFFPFKIKNFLIRTIKKKKEKEIAFVRILLQFIAMNFINLNFRLFNLIILLSIP